MSLRITKRMNAVLSVRLRTFTCVSGNRGRYWPQSSSLRLLTSVSRVLSSSSAYWAVLLVTAGGSGAAISTLPCPPAVWDGSSYSECAGVVRRPSNGEDNGSHPCHSCRSCGMRRSTYHDLYEGRAGGGTIGDVTGPPEMEGTASSVGPNSLSFLPRRGLNWSRVELHNFEGCTVVLERGDA